MGVLEVREIFPLPEVNPESLLLHLFIHNHYKVFTRVSSSTSLDATGHSSLTSFVQYRQGASLIFSDVLVRA